MKTIKTMLFTVIIMGLVLPLQAQMTRPQAENFVTGQLLAGELNSVDVYVYPSMFPGDSTLTLRNHQHVQLPYSENWLFFVDDHPVHDWAHPCRYIAVNPADGSHQVIEEDYYPFRLHADYLALSKMTRPDRPAPAAYESTTTLDSAPPNPHLYAVIICPTDNEDDDRHWNHTSVMYTTLTEQYGYTEENIFVHYAQGEATLGNEDDFNAENNDDIDYDAFKTTVMGTFSEMAGTSDTIPEIPELGPKDQLFVFFTDHGWMSDDFDTSFIQLPLILSPQFNTEYDMSDRELAEWLAPINCAQMIVTIQACQSGGFSRQLADYENYDVQCENRVIHTASDSTSAYTNRLIYNYKMSEFILHWQAAVRGYYSQVPETWEPWYAADEFPFEDYYTNHPGSMSPDSDGDGIVQMGETFEYAYYFDKGTDEGYSPNPPVYYIYPTESGTIAFQEDLLSLHGMQGKVTHTQTVDGNFLFSGNLEIDNQATVEFVSGSSLYFYGESQIIVHEDAKLVLYDNVAIEQKPQESKIIVYGTLEIHDNTMLADIEIKNGGKLIIADDVTLAENRTLTLRSGAIVEGTSGVNTLTIRGNLNNLENVTFSNLTHNNQGGVEIYGLRNNSQQIKNATFNNSNLKVKMQFADCTLENNTFTASSVELDLFSDYYVGYCRVKNNEFTNISASEALRIENFNMYNVQNNVVKHNSGNGIAIYNSGNVNYPARSISGNEIFGNHNSKESAAGLLIYSSVAEVYNNSIYENDYGLKLHHKSQIRMFGIKESIEQKIYSEVYDNNRHQILAYENSFPWEFQLNVIDGKDSRYPWIEVVDRKIQVYDVRYNCWGKYWGSDFILEPEAAFEYDPEWDCGYTPGGLLPREPEELFRSGMTAIDDKNYSEAETIMKNVVSSYPESPFAASAMKTLPMLTLELGQPMDELISYFSNTPAIQEQTQLAKLADYLKADCQVHKKAYAEALTFYEGIIANPPTQADSIYAQIDAGRVQYLMEANGDKAASNFKYASMIPATLEGYKTNRKKLLDEIGGAIMPQTEEEQTEEANAEMLAENRLAIYPNPAGNEATISYQVAAKSDVVIQIWNTTGQQVYNETLNTKTAGMHHHTVATTALPQGVYLVRLQVNSAEQATKRLIINR